MPFFDMPLEELRTYRPRINEPADFDDFWQKTLKRHTSPELLENASIRAVNSHVKTVDAWEVVFSGYDDQPIHGRYTRPASTLQDLPIIVEFVGYGGGRGLLEEHLAWASSGFAHLIVDTRGQGAQWSGGGHTGDAADAGASGGGFMTRGITSPQTYYYRRAFADSAQALQLARLLPGVSPEQVIPCGGSQGGALSIASAALDGNVAGFIANVPFLSHFERAVGLTGGYPYQEIVDYLAVKRDEDEAVFQTLAYFDCVNLAKRTKAPSLFSVALMDEVTPPSTVFATANWCPEPHDMNVYRFNGHEGGGPYQVRAQIEWAKNLVGL